MGYLISCLFAALLVCCLVPLVPGQELPTYTVYRSGNAIVIDGRLDEPAWVSAPDVGPFVFPWWTEGKQEHTVAKLLWDDEKLYVSYVCEDAHIWAGHTQRDSAVYLDDCVEVFTAPNPDRPRDYYQIEMNVLGIFLDHFNPEDSALAATEEWNAEGVQIATSIAGTLNDDTDVDQYWILEAAIPLRNFRGVARHTPPEPGDLWRLNLNRLGGRTNRQYSQWSASRTETPQFHAPDDFGRVTFSKKTAPFWRQ